MLLLECEQLPGISQNIKDVGIDLKRKRSVPNSASVDGDPSQDVTYASVLFLVDAKLVLLQPSQDEEGAPKYDMRIVANGVEYFFFTPDEPRTLHMPETTESVSNPDPREDTLLQSDSSLKNSLWFFDGQGAKFWIDVQDLLRLAGPKESKDIPSPTSIPIDFYPTNIALREGVIVGLESELVQRRVNQFALMRLNPRVIEFYQLVA